MDKFEAMNLTPMEGEFVKAPLIKESPINLECKVTQVLELPTHDVFIAEIVKVHVDEELVDENGKIHFEQAKLVAYNHGEYFGIKNKPIGKFGYSVMKPKTKNLSFRNVKMHMNAQRQIKLYDFILTIKVGNGSQIQLR